MLFYNNVYPRASSFTQKHAYDIFLLYPHTGGMEDAMKKEALKYLKMAQSQVNAAIKMTENDRYCVDVSHQILASISLLKKANEQMLKEHMNNCLVDAFKQGNEEEKLEEVIQLIHKMID